MKLKLKNVELIDFYFAMKKISEIENHSKILINALIYNEDKLKNEVDALVKCSIPGDKYKEYESKREQLIVKYSYKDENGKMVVDENNNMMIKINPEFVEESKQKFKELDDEYVEILDIRKTELKEYYELLDMETEIDIKQVHFRYIPNNINKNMLRALKYFIISGSDEDIE